MKRTNSQTFKNIKVKGEIVMDIPILGKNKQQRPQQRVQIDPSKLANVVCPECGSIYFETVQMIKVISELQSQSGQKEMVPIPILKCSNPICGKIIDRPGDHIKHIDENPDTPSTEEMAQNEEE